MTARAAWASLSLGFLLAGIVIAGIPPKTMPPVECSTAAEDVISPLIAFGVPIVVFFVLGYLALAEHSLRWRVPEFVVTVLLILPALQGGTYAATALTGCQSPVFGTDRTPPEPTPWPSGTPLRIEASADSPVGREYTTEANIAVHTLPGASCTIDARYHDAKTLISGLEPQIAPAPWGWFGWGWTIPEDAPLGTATYTVTCSLEKATVRWSDTFEVWQSVSPAPNS